MERENGFYDKFIEEMEIKDEKMISLYKELEPLVSEWKVMKKSNKEEADEFYNNKILPLSKQIFIDNPSNNTDKEYDCLFTTVGDTPSPVILAILATKPKIAFLFHTERTEKYIDFIARSTDLSLAQCKPIKINGSNIAELYKKMKDAYTEHQGKNIAIDITGGKKTMSSGAAMAGFILNADIFYIDNHKYNTELRLPEPGTEFLYKIENPLEVFGDIDLQLAVNLFNAYNYSRSTEILKEIEKKVPDNRLIRLVRLLAETYKDWDNLVIEDAKNHICELLDQIERYERAGLCFKMLELKPKLQKQKHQLDILSELFIQLEKESKKYDKYTQDILKDIEKVKILMFFLYKNAQRRKARSDYDTTALVLYRILELIMQRRLMCHGIFVEKPDYSCNTNITLSKFNNKSKEIYKSNKYYEKEKLPTPIAQMDGYILLSVINDPIASIINKIYDNSDQRNFSLLAHGFKPMSKSDLNGPEWITNEKVKQFCDIENINFESEISDFEFCCLPKDENLWLFYNS